jgi:hypothetical protein
VLLDAIEQRLSLAVGITRFEAGIDLQNAVSANADAGCREGLNPPSCATMS